MYMFRKQALSSPTPAFHTAQKNSPCFRGAGSELSPRACPTGFCESVTQLTGPSAFPGELWASLEQYVSLPPQLLACGWPSMHAGGRPLKSPPLPLLCTALLSKLAALKDCLRSFWLYLLLLFSFPVCHRLLLCLYSVQWNWSSDRVLECHSHVKLP